STADFGAALVGDSIEAALSMSTRSHVAKFLFFLFLVICLVLFITGISVAKRCYRLTRFGTQT
ncbi:MAG: hypothetical protein DME42_02055, partial [Verrucomicrobia bacterium]